MPDDVGGQPFQDGEEPDSRDHGPADDEFASVVLDEDFVRSAEVHEPTAAERILAAAQSHAESEIPRLLEEGFGYGRGEGEFLHDDADPDSDDEGRFDRSDYDADFPGDGRYADYPEDIGHDDFHRYDEVDTPGPGHPGHPGAHGPAHGLFPRPGISPGGPYPTASGGLPPELDPAYEHGADFGYAHGAYGGYGANGVNGASRRFRGPYGAHGGALRPYRGHGSWQRPIAWVLAVVMGIGMVALAFTAVYRGASGQRQEPVTPPATTGVDPSAAPAIPGALPSVSADTEAPVASGESPEG